MVIDSNTRIASILKHNPASLEAIISINSCFQKLRNPLLRKLMAGRTTVAMASRIGGCSVEEFCERLQPLGFDTGMIKPVVQVPEKEVPAFIKELREENLHLLDVRPLITSGRDPLNIIMTKLNSVEPGHTLKIINTFEPTPLILLLKKKGFESYVDHLDDQLIETYFYKTPLANTPVIPEAVITNDFEHIRNKFGGRMKSVDVRGLEMPKPMIHILEALEQLPEGFALFVQHKRIPVYLLPELTEKGFEFRIDQVSDHEVNLLIFR